MNTPPLVSILVPAYNHEAYVEELIRSIWRQNGPEMEIIVVDDGSSDRTHEIASALVLQSPCPMRVLRQDNRGINATLNRALEMAQGEFSAIIASDDRFADGRFPAQLQLFAAQPGLQVVYGNGRYWSGEELGGQVHDAAMQRRLNASPQEMLAYLVSHVPALFIQTCLFRTAFLRRIGGFDESLLADDWPLNIRIFSHLESRREFAFVDRDVFHYRQHGANSHRDYALHSRRVLEVIEKYTPAALKPAFLAEQHANLAMLALASLRWRAGLRHLLTSQRMQPNALRLLVFLYKLCRYPLKRLLRT